MRDDRRAAIGNDDDHHAVAEFAFGDLGAVAESFVQGGGVGVERHAAFMFLRRAPKAPGVRPI
jgi:hypothetical protein